MTATLLTPYETLEANSRIRLDLYREIRRPQQQGSSKLASLLEQIVGDVVIQKAMLTELIEQAKLFGSSRALAILKETLETKERNPPPKNIELK